MADEDIVQVEVSPVEAEAREFGWVPKEEFKGNPDEWRDADTFLSRGREINGFLRKDLEKISNKYERTKAELDEVRQTMEEFRKYHNETEARAYKRAIEELKREKIEAVNEGNGERVVAIEEQIETLKQAQDKPAVKAPEAQSTAPNTAYISWAKANLWYETDAELRAYADLVADEVQAEIPGIKGKEFLDEVTKRVKEDKPEKFSNPARSNAAVSSSADGRAPAGKPNRKSYDNLPPEAKAACDRFVKQKLMTREQYVSEYQWD